MDVVAVLAVDEDLQVDADALGGLEEHDLRVLQVGEPPARGARGDHLGGDDLVVEQPAQYVHLVHGRVQGGHGGGVRLRDGRVAVGAVHDQRLADAAGVDDLLHLPVSGVVAAHEADLDQAAAVGRLGLDDPQAVLGGRGERLLAEHRFPGGYRVQHVLGVGRAPDVTRTASTSSAAITAAPSARTRAPTGAAASSARAASMSVTAVTRAPVTVWVRRRMCSLPIQPAPMTAYAHSHGW